MRAFEAAGIDASGFFMGSTDFMNGQPIVTENTIKQWTGAFMCCYERPGAQYAVSSYATRCQSAVTWYNYISLTPIVGGKSWLWKFVNDRNNKLRNGG